MTRRIFQQYEFVKLAKLVQTNMQLMAPGEEVEVEGYWDEITGESWMANAGNWACRVYSERSAAAGLPVDDEVVYVKYDGLGSLIHVTELEPA